MGKQCGSRNPNKEVSSPHGSTVRPRPATACVRHAIVVFVDETGITTDLLRRYARGVRGLRVGDRAPFGRWHTSTLIAGVRISGLTAPCVIDGPIDHDTALAYVQQILVPTLRPGDRVISD